jgi:F-type H+-transporting ATPase subunit delta
MKETTLSIRYARALIDALGEGEHENVRKQFESVIEMIAGNNLLIAFLANPFVEDEDKTSVVTQIAQRAELNDLLRNFIFLLVRKNRVSAIEDIFFSFDRMVTGMREQVEAIVETPVELSAADLESIQGRITPLFEKKVELKMKIDPDILGGVRVRTGDKVIDATVDNSLQLIKQSIIKG